MTTRRQDSNSAILQEILQRIDASVWAAEGAENDYAIRVWNRGAEQIYGYSATEALGKNYIELFVNPYEQAQAIEDHEDIVRSGRAFRSVANDILKSGEERMLLTSGFPLADPISGRPLLAELGVDITHLERDDFVALQKVRETSIRKFEAQDLDELLDNLTRLNSALALPHMQLDEIAVLELGLSVLSDFLRHEIQSSIWLGNVVADQSPTFTTAGWRPPPNLSMSQALSHFGKHRTKAVIIDGLAVPSRASVANFVRKGRSASPFALVPLNGPDGALALQAIVLPDDAVFSDRNRSVLPVLCTFILGNARLVYEIRKRREQATTLQEETTRLQLTGDFAHRISRSVDPVVRNLTEAQSLLRNDGYDKSSDVMVLLNDALLSSRELAEAPDEIRVASLPAKILVWNHLSAARNRVMARSPDVQLTLIGDQSIRVMAIAGEIRSLVEDVIDNAVEAMDGRGSIEVLLTSEDEFAVLTIADSGPGIAEQIVDRIFIAGESTRGIGRGKGLARASQICSGVGGEITLLTSTGGATFQIKLPMLKET